MKSSTPPVELNVLREEGKVGEKMPRPPQQALERYACVYKGNINNSPECLAKDKRCNGRKGHFKAKCRSGMQGSIDRRN